MRAQVKGYLELTENKASAEKLKERDRKFLDKKATADRHMEKKRFDKAVDEMTECLSLFDRCAGRASRVRSESFRRLSRSGPQAARRSGGVPAENPSDSIRATRMNSRRSSWRGSLAFGEGARI